MICPRCGYEQNEAVECISCGVIINKYIRSNPDSLAPPGDRSGGDTYVKAYETKMDAPLVSSSTLWFLAIFTICIASYFSLKFMINSGIKDDIGKEVSVALQTDLKHNFKKTVITNRIIEICKDNAIEDVTDNRVIVEFLPENDPISNGKINYIVRVKITYDTFISGYKKKNEVDVEVHDAYDDDGGIVSLRLKGMLDI